MKPLFIATAIFSITCYSIQIFFNVPPVAADYTQVPGQNYEICNEQSQYLTSVYTYDALSSGSQSYSVAQYQALPGYGSTLPSLPSYILSEPSTTEAAEIFAPGATVNLPEYDFPNSPIIYYFEGGSYGELALGSVSGDEFIGGSATGFPEPVFDSGGAAGGINAQNGSYDFSGGQSTLTSPASVNATTITTTTTIPGYVQYVNFADGTSYQIASTSGNSITLQSGLTKAEGTGTNVWASRSQPVAFVASAAAQGASTVTLTPASTIPFMQYATAVIGADSDTVQAVSGTQSGGYTLTISGGLDYAAAAGTPVYYNGNSGSVTVEYLSISHDDHNTTGTIFTGTGEGWTIEHNDIYDGNDGKPGDGVALYGGGEGTIEYNCLSQMGDYGINAFGTNTVFDYNEIYESNYDPDPGCGCSGGGKWWGTLNADIIDNAFIGDGYGGGGAIWLDNGNSGTDISGNYFYQTYGEAISDETGFDADITNNLFEDDNWASGTGCGNSNCTGDVGMNTSGGFEVPGSRYEDEMQITDNQFLNDWGGISIWQSGSRSCENSGEAWEPDAPYCSGGFPNTNATTAGSNYYFTHEGNIVNGGTGALEADASSGSSTVLVQGNEAIDDQIDFQNPASTTTNQTTNVTSFTGTGVITVGSTGGFPSSGQLYVTTSAGNAILAYTGTTATTFTGVLLINDSDTASSGTLSGSIVVNDPAYATTTASTNVTNFTGSQSLPAASTAGFPSSGQLRVGTSEAWGAGGGSYTGAILSYSGISGNSFTGVSLVRGSGTLGGAIMEVQPYKVTGETCYTNDCAVTITPALSSSVAAGDNVTNVGTCQLFATAGATPLSPMDPVSSSSPYYESYWDGCQWEARDISVTGNTFTIQPSVMDATAPLTGGTTSCTAANSCGTNFMSDQPSGEPPFDDQAGANAMMSSSTFSGCPSWDSGCTSDPLNNINALSDPPNAPPGNGETPYNNVWSDNTYIGATWAWNVFIYGSCDGSMPTDPTTNATLSTNACGPINFSTWQADWQQDTGSTSSDASPPSTPTNVTAAANSSTSVTVNWSASTDTGGPGLGGYYILRNGTQIGSASSSATSYPDNTASANTQYSYTVEAYDTATPADVSAASSAAVVTTPASGSSPTVSLTSLSNNELIHGSSFSITTADTPTSGNTISQSQLLVGSTVTQTLTSAPYTFTLNTPNYPDGSYTLTCKATDNQGHVGNASDTVIINNGDLNGDGTVNLSDLAIMADHWGQTDSNYSDGNISGQSTINISDLAILAANWGWSNP